MNINDVIELDKAIELLDITQSYLEDYNLLQIGQVRFKGRIVRICFMSEVEAIKNRDDYKEIRIKSKELYIKYLEKLIYDYEMKNEKNEADICRDMLKKIEMDLRRIKRTSKAKQNTI